MILATFIVLPNGLLCFHRPEIDWQELVLNSTLQTSNFSPVIFEDEKVQREYIMKFIQVLGELTLAENLIYMRYIVEIAQTPSRYFDPNQKAKVVDFYPDESFLCLDRSSPIYKFYKQQP